MKQLPDLEATEREIARLESELNQQQGHLAVLRKTIEESVMQEKNPGCQAKRPAPKTVS